MTGDKLRYIVTHQYSSVAVVSSSFWEAHVFVPSRRRQIQDSRMPPSYGVLPTSVGLSGQVDARIEDNCSWSCRLNLSDDVVTS